MTGLSFWPVCKSAVLFGEKLSIKGLFTPLMLFVVDGN